MTGHERTKINVSHIASLHKSYNTCKVSAACLFQEQRRTHLDFTLVFSWMGLSSQEMKQMCWLLNMDQPRVKAVDGLAARWSPSGGSFFFKLHTQSLRRQGVSSIHARRLRQRGAKYSWDYWPLPMMCNNQSLYWLEFPKVRYAYCLQQSVICM